MLYVDRQGEPIDPAQHMRLFSDPAYPLAIFGPLWDAPVCEDAIGFPTPVGTPCAGCGVPIEEKDSGLITPHGQADDTVDRLHWHGECFCT
jgi:hypothetical protein